MAGLFVFTFFFTLTVCSFTRDYLNARKINHDHVVFMEHSTEAYVYGMIDHTTTKLITRWLRKNPKGELTIWLDSSGGYGEDAVEMAYQMRQRGHINTIASNNCYSSCTILWLAGSKRTVLNGVTLGFHGAFPSGTFASVDSNSIQCEFPNYSWQFLSLSTLDEAQELLLKTQEPEMAKILLPLKPYELHNGSYVAVTKHGEGWTVRYHLSYYAEGKDTTFSWKPSHPKLLKANQLSTYDEHFKLVKQRPAPLDNPTLDCQPSWSKNDMFYAQVDEAKKMLASIDTK